MGKMHILILQMFLLHSGSLGKAGRGPFSSHREEDMSRAGNCCMLLLCMRREFEFRS